MNTRRNLLAGMGAVALGGLLWNRLPVELDNAVAEETDSGSPSSYFPNVWL
jgi:hypothetical protein